MHYSVLIVDDETELSEYTARYFNMSGVSAYYVLDAESAEEFFKENTCSLVLLDINLGKDSGFDLCQKIRLTMDVPIFFISARSAEDDMLLALSIGGDDYICKPYSLGVLLAKVKAELKRYEESAASRGDGASASEGADKEADEGIVKLGNAVINLRSASVEKDGKKQPLKAMEYKMLIYLLENRKRIVTKDELLKNVWDDEYIGEGTLAVHIRHLREKIEKDPKNPEVIKTVWGVGYMID